jgi:hypothetical protein
MSRIVIVMLIYRRHKPIDSINLLDLCRRYNVFPVRYGQTYGVELQIKVRTMDNVQNCDDYKKLKSLAFSLWNLNSKSFR